MLSLSLGLWRRDLGFGVVVGARSREPQRFLLVCFATHLPARFVMSRTDIDMDFARVLAAHADAVAEASSYRVSRPRSCVCLPFSASVHIVA